MNLLKRITAAWQHLRRRKRLKTVVLVQSMNDIPANTGSKLYLVYRGGQYRRAVLNCPCRCGRRIDINLNKHSSPHWVVTHNGNEASLDPSLWVPADQCGSHFFIRRNRIEWV